MLERFWESKDKLEERLRALEAEIASLKSKLNDTNEKKEFWFVKKEELKNELQESIKQVKNLRVEKDNLDGDIQKLKKERNEYNKIVGELISKVKLLNKEREELFKKSALKINPEKIRERIEALEKQIETEVISFSKEQKLMKAIKNLKGQYSEINEVAKIASHVSQLSNEIEVAKSKAQELHKKVQEYAKKDEQEYNEFIENSRNINNVRQEQEKAFRRFVELKRLYILINNDLKLKLDELSNVKKRFEKFSPRVDVMKNKDKEISQLKEKLKYVEEKLKKGEKLTTEDIMIFQKGTEGT